jgi:hypothetical protein
VVVPEHTLRLFPGLDAAELAGPEAPSRDLLIGRLLEHGDGEDLRWLAATLGETALAEWLERHGWRLSRRSLPFWELVLGRRAPARPAAAAELWPL